MARRRNFKITKLNSKGVVLDKLFESIISDKKINIDDIIIGDKNAIVVF